MTNDELNRAIKSAQSTDLSIETIPVSPVVEDGPANMMSIISKAAQNKDVDVDKMTALLSMQERIMEKQSLIDFGIALNKAQRDMPQIDKTAEGHNSKYAKLEDIERAIRPTYQGHGFSVSYNTRKNDDKTKTYFLMLGHEGGHTQTYEIDLPDDSSGSKNSIQAVGSSATYARRNLLKLAFNIIEKDEDDDGNLYQNNPLDDVQLSNIQSLIDDTGADAERFCKFMKSPSIKQIRQKDYLKAVNQLENKKRVMEGESNA